MKKIINGVKYEINPIPPSLAPYHARINELLSRTPENLQEVKAASAELRVLITELLKETVKPTPAEEDELALFNALLQVTNQTLKGAQFFRKKQRPHTDKGGAAGPASAQAPQRDPQSGSSEVQ